MNKIPRITGNVMVKYLIKKGFSVSSRKESHVTLRCDHISKTIPAKLKG